MKSNPFELTGEWRTSDEIPSLPGWYYTASLNNGIIVSRYFDDSDKSWWYATARDGFAPNNSFDVWLWIENITGDRLGSS